VLLVRSFPIVYYLGADSDDYLLHALNLADHFRYSISGRDAFFETVRTPGYALLLAGIFLAFGKHLSTVILVQSILFMAAVSCVALALRRWASTALLGALVAIAAIMPPDIEMSRGIQSDGPAATFALFSVAAFIEAGCREEKSRRTMMWLGAATAAFAVMVRPTAIVVLIIPGLMALQTRRGGMAGGAMAFRTGRHSGPLDRDGPDDRRVARVVDAQLGAVQISRRVELHADHSDLPDGWILEHSIFDPCIMMNDSANRISSGATAPAIGSITCISSPPSFSSRTRAAMSARSTPDCRTS